jgi:hypothetical protein
MTAAENRRRRPPVGGRPTGPRYESQGVRSMPPADGPRSGFSGPFEDASEPPRRPDERSGVRILQPDAQTGAPRRQVRRVPPPGETADAVLVEDEEPPHVPTRDRVLGVNIIGDVAHLAVIEPPDRAVLDLVDQLSPTSDADDSRRLAKFAEGAAHVLRELGIAVVVVARPLRYTNWTYANAFERVSLETCFMLEAHRLSLRFESIGQQHAANVVGLPAQQLTDSLPTRLRIPKTPDWTNRYPALLVALAVALEM